MRQDLINWIKVTAKTMSLERINNHLIKTGYNRVDYIDEMIEVFGYKPVIDYFIKIDNPDDGLYPKVKTLNKNQLIIDGKACKVLFELKLPNIVMVDNFLSDRECEDLINLSKPKIKRSTVVDRESTSSKVDDIRTSKGTFFEKKENELISDIENRIALFTNWPVDNQEGLQILNYCPGEEYKPHNDYFDETAPSSKEIFKRGGQRLGTIIIYLNNCPEGGGTIFPEIGLELKPTKGCAVFFGYPSHDKNSKTLHGGSPVIKGEKWVAVKWLRQDKFV